MVQFSWLGGHTGKRVVHCTMLGTWLSLVEVTALRMDAKVFACLMQAVPRLGSMSGVDNAQYQYWLRLFDTVEADNDKIEYRRCGRLHRDHDLPAVEWRSGARSWYRHGAFFRDHDQPAQIGSDSTQIWCNASDFHRLGGPAIVSPADDFSAWYVHGQRHRKDRPAVMWQGREEFWQDGVFLY